MSLERTGVAAFVSDFTDRIEMDDIDLVDEPPDERHLQIHYIPEENDHPDVEQFHDILVREASQGVGTRPVPEPVHGPFDREPAVKRAVEEARERDTLLLNPIYRLE